MAGELGLKRDEKGRLVEGTAPGPGRPKGSISIKDRVRKYLEDHPEDVEEIVKHFVKSNRELMWQMLEGRPQQDIVSDGKQLPQPLLYAIPDNNSDKENSQPQETN